MNKVLKIYTRISILLFPFFYLVGVINGFGFGKNWFLGASALVGLLLWVIDLLISKKHVVKTSWPLLVMTVLTIWSAVTFFKLSPGGQMSSLMNPLGMGTMISLLIWLFLLIQVSDKDEFKKQLNFLSVAGVVVGVTSLITFLIPTSKLPLNLPKDNPLISISSGFSMTGSVLSELILLLFLVVEWLKRLTEKLKEKSEVSGYITEAVLIAFFGLMLFLGIYKVVKLGWGVLDIKTAWVIATETLKVSPIFGIGIGNFTQAFNAFRPISFNSTSLWSMVFSSSSMGILQIWTEIGTIGLVLTGWLVSGVLKQKKEEGFWSVALIFALTLFTPVTLLSVFMLIWLLANRLFEVKEHKLILEVGEKKVNALPIIISVILLAGMGFGGYWWTRVLMGEIYLRESLVKASKNDGTGTYNLQIKAIGANPYNSEYRKLYSQTNLAIAQNMLSNQEISQEDKEKASTLVQQSVREAKAAISLNERNAEYWTNLAAIYKSLAGLVDGAPDWSLQAYQQAVALDPVNPLLKLDMGGLLFAANKFSEADRIFEQAVISKSDYANAWYNWAYTAKKNNDIQNAVNRLDQALKLVPADSGDYETASKELEAWKKELDEATKKQQTENKEPETLKTAEPIPTVAEDEKVEVSENEMQPPAGEEAKAQVLPVTEIPTE